MTEHESSTDPEFRAGDRIRTEIGEFEVQRVLGTGGMGVVYQVVRDERHGGRQFALKTILPELLNRREVVDRFEAEGRVLAKFDQENIIKIDGIFTMHSTPPRPFILMELLQGYTLRYVMDQYEEPLPVNDVCTVAIGVCNALEETHKHGVVHRDIKPENIFIQKRRKHTRVVLIDFGIMKLVLGGTGKHTTKLFLGSYSNASPEQLLGKEVTPRSDFYSLGTALYEMLSGGPLFPNILESRAIGQAHVDLTPVSLHERAPHVPHEIADIVMRALAKDPAARPKDTHAFRQPFTTARNRLLRDQAQSAGHSTIERFLTNTVGAERVPAISSDPSRGQTVRLAAPIRPELRDTTMPSGPPCGGTQPDSVVEPLQEAIPSAVPVVARPAAKLTPAPIVELGPTVIVSDEPPTPSPLREEPIEWETPRGLAAIPVPAPNDVFAGPGTDPTSTRDLPAPRAKAGSARPSGGTTHAARSRASEGDASLPGRPRLPRVLLGLAAAAWLGLGTFYAARIVERRLSPNTTAVAVSVPQTTAIVPSPVPSATPDLPGGPALPTPTATPPQGSTLPVPPLTPTSLAAAASAPSAVVDAGPSAAVDAGQPSTDSPRPAAEQTALPRPPARAPRPKTTPKPASSFIGLFEDIKPAPAPSASAPHPMPGAGF